MSAHMRTHLLVCSLMLLWSLSPIPASAERVWDSELKRYLTEQEMTMAEVFLTEEEALKLMFPKSARVRKEALILRQSVQQIHLARTKPPQGWHQRQRCANPHRGVLR